MEGATFEARVQPREDFGPSGGDEVEFLIAPNPGVPARPLRETASGGGVPSTSASTSIRATRSTRNNRTSSARWHQPSRYQRPATFVTRIGSTSRSVASSRDGTR